MCLADKIKFCTLLSLEEIKQDDLGMIPLRGIILMGFKHYEKMS